MPITTYPLNGIQYDAKDAEAYHCTRTSGVYSSEDDFQITASGGRILTISPGIAWINNGRFKGKSIVSDSPESLEIPLADGQMNRIDLVVLRFDENENSSYFAVKSGALASNPVAPTVSRENGIFELGLYLVRMNAGSVEVTGGNITSVILDESYCGIMRDAVTKIPTNQLLADANALLEEMRQESELLGTGQGAYAAAQAGGYTGTREDFYRQLSEVDQLPPIIVVGAEISEVV